MKWKIFYIDGTSFSNEEGNPEDAPGSGLAAIAQEDGVVGVAIHYGQDFYCFGEQYKGWVGMDYFGLGQYLAKPGFKIIKLGEAMDTVGYRELLAKIKVDPTLPNKSARYPWEGRF
jgi:hypothetical protein